MLWRVRTTLADRPGALADLAQRCGANHVNVLGLQIFPEVHGVTDELVLRAPDSWGLVDVARMVESAGGRDVTVAPCTVHALHDAPTRYLRAAGRLAADPHQLGAVLADVLDADGEDADPALRPVQDVLEVQAAGGRATLRRVVPFTETERARAAAFAELAERVLRRAESMYEETARPVAGRRPVIKLGQLSDVAAVVRMHERCSGEAMHRRFHAPMPRLGWRMAVRLVAPQGGAALLAVVRSEVVGMVTIAPCTPGEFEIGVLVEDAWQGRGVGAALVHQAARLARGRGAESISCVVHADNEALLPTLRRSGLRARVRSDDGNLLVTASVRDFDPITGESAHEASPLAEVPDSTTTS
jgi:GNAT superfamily N-acetyltransferase